MNRTNARLRPLLAALAVLCLLLRLFPALALPSRAQPVDAAAVPDPCRCRLTPDEEQLLALTLAESAPEASFAARVGMAAAVLGRMGSPGYPDALPEVLAGLRAEGAFGADRTDPHGETLSAGPLRSVGDLLSDGFARIAGTGAGEDADRRLTELSLHAVRLAEAGADPAGGALGFRIVRIPRARDFLFNDAGEDARLSEIRGALRDYPVILGDVGFR